LVDRSTLVVVAPGTVLAVGPGAVEVVLLSSPEFPHAAAANPTTRPATTMRLGRRSFDMAIPHGVSTRRADTRIRFGKLTEVHAACQAMLGVPERARSHGDRTGGTFGT
jgi:hypothetical protein